MFTERRFSRLDEPAVAVPVQMDTFLTKGKAALGGIKNLAAGYTEIEVKVRDATNNEPWGASGTVRRTVLCGRVFSGFAQCAIVDARYCQCDAQL